MSDVIVEVIKGGWPILPFALAVYLLGLALFGFLPGVFTRLFARIYPKKDPRRAEMIAELYAVPRIDQPSWVAQQAERAISEGIAARIGARRTRRATEYLLDPFWEWQDARLYIDSSADRIAIEASMHRQRVTVRETITVAGRHRSERVRVEWIVLESDVEEYTVSIASGELRVRMYFSGQKSHPVGIDFIELATTENGNV